MVYRWYRYFEPIPILAGTTISWIGITRPLPPHTNDLYLDAAYEIYNEGNLRLSGSIFFVSHPLIYTTEYKKKGAGSWIIPAAGGEEIHQGYPYNIPIIAGDSLSYWLRAEDDFLGRCFWLQTWGTGGPQWHPLCPVLPPPPPPPFTPIWQKQIGGL